MKIVYSPFYSGNYFLNLQDQTVVMDVQVLETQGLLSQLAMHAGIHQEIPSFPERLTSYHKALLEFDDINKDNLFHRSIEIDSMSVAKTLLRWRDNLSLCGWNSETKLENCSRLNTLAVIDTYFQDSSLAQLLQKLSRELVLMIAGKRQVPKVYTSLTIEIPCPLDMLPDFIQPLLKSLHSLGTMVQEKTDDVTAKPETITEIHFSQLWKAEAWLSQQSRNSFDVWINSDNKRLDNWFHMSGHPVCGSEMTDSNPQITQMFLLAVGLFQRPLNVNTFLQYLFLPECPLDRQLGRKLARHIVHEGGFCNEKVQQCINDYIENEYKAPDDKIPQEMTREQREEEYLHYLPFDLRKDEGTLPLADETDIVNTKNLTGFLESIRDYAKRRAVKIAALLPYDARIAQLRSVNEMTDALLGQITALAGKELSYTKLSQWAQSLYEDGDYTLFHAQAHCSTVINSPSNMISKSPKTVWCDFYGDVDTTLSTDFLSNYEQEQLVKHGVLLWNRQHESDLRNQLFTRPVYKTEKNLTVITCGQQGATKLPMHPLYLQLPFITEQVDGDSLYNSQATKEVEYVDNHRKEDDIEIQFDSRSHPVTWRKEESFSAMEKLLQNPLDYMMNYTLQFTDAGDTEIKLVLTYGNVAHEVIEYLFTADRSGKTLLDFVADSYDYAFNRALVKKGALLLLPEHHLDRDRLMYLLRGCARKLAVIIQENGLTVLECEQKEEQDLGFMGGIVLNGYIDMLLKDKSDNKVVFDLKWASKKDKYKTILENNRAMQLAIYQAMLMKHEDHPDAVHTAYFVMPIGKLFSTDDFFGDNCERISPKTKAAIMDQLRNGYAERVREINAGHIETADNKPIKELSYTQAENVYPLEDDGKKRDPKKIENLYSDYKCFTI